MAEYISKETLQVKLNRKKAGAANKRYTEGWNDAVLMVKSMIHGEKAADVAPVVHGRWIYTGKYGEYECSVCHGIDTDCSDYYSIHVVTEQDYCPNCGAKMDGKGDV